MKVKFFIVDQSFILNKCVISTRTGQRFYKPESFFCFGEFPNQTRYINSHVLFFLFNEIQCCPGYRRAFGRYVRHLNGFLVLRLEPVQSEALDKKWGEITSQTIWECLELDYIMSWLSTLGGAFSALGDYDLERADIAGRISLQQLKLALRLGDPVTIVRCKLFMSIALIQKFLFKDAKKLLKEQYRYVMSYKEPNQVLVNMCLGIWSKLRYTRILYRQGKTLKDVVQIPESINEKPDRGVRSQRVI